VWHEEVSPRLLVRVGYAEALRKMWPIKAEAIQADADMNDRLQALIDQWRLHPSPEVGSCANQLAGWLRTQEEEKELARGGNQAVSQHLQSSASETEVLSATAPDDHDCIDWNSGGACFVCRRPLSVEEQLAPDAPKQIAAKLQTGAELIRQAGVTPSTVYDDTEWRFMKEHPSVFECANVMEQAAEAVLQLQVVADRAELRLRRIQEALRLLFAVRDAAPTRTGEPQP
jgi:hypothetical protein